VVGVGGCLRVGFRASSKGFGDGFIAGLRWIVVIIGLVTFLAFDITAFFVRFLIFTHRCYDL